MAEAVGAVNGNHDMVTSGKPVQSQAKLGKAKESLVDAADRIGMPSPKDGSSWD